MLAYNPVCQMTGSN